MSKIPDDTPKSKYNNNDAFRWVDSQWEKFMNEQKEHKATIKKLQKDLGTCTEHFQKLRVENKELKETVREIGGKDLYKYLYHSTDSNQVELFED